MEFKQIDTQKILERRVESLFVVKNLTEGKVTLKDCSFYSYLNELVSQIEEPEKYCYLEVGVFVGTTLMASAFGNEAMCYGVDNFSTMCRGRNAEITLKENLDKCDIKNIKYFKSNYQDFFKDREDVDGKKVKIYFYDGAHDYGNQYNGLVEAKGVLADEAIVLVHDTYGSECAPWKATHDVVRDEEEFELLQDVPHSDEWPSGVMILSFKRKVLDNEKEI